MRAPKNIENNPMQSSWRPRNPIEKQFDTSGKSLALLHDRAISQLPVARNSEAFRAIAGEIPTHN